MHIVLGSTDDAVMKAIGLVFGLLPYVRDGDLKSQDVFKGK